MCVCVCRLEPVTCPIIRNECNFSIEVPYPESMDLLRFDSEVEWSRIVLAAYATSPAVQNASSMDQWQVTYANPFGFAGDGAWEDGVPWDRQEPIQADLAMNRALLTTGTKASSKPWLGFKEAAFTLENAKVSKMFAVLPEYSNAIWGVARDVIANVYGVAVVHLLDREPGVLRAGWLIAMIDGCFHTIPWYSARLLCRLGMNALSQRRGTFRITPPNGTFERCVAEWGEVRRKAGVDRDDVNKAACVFHKIAGRPASGCRTQGRKFWLQYAARHKAAAGHGAREL